MPRRRRPGRKASKPSRPRHHPPLPRGGKRPGAGRPPSVIANANRDPNDPNAPPPPLVSISSRIPADLRDRLIAAADAADATVSAVILAALQRYLLPLNSPARSLSNQSAGGPITSPATNTGVVQGGGDDPNPSNAVLCDRSAGETADSGDMSAGDDMSGSEAGDGEGEAGDTEDMSEDHDTSGDPSGDLPSWDSVEGEGPLVL